MLVSPSVEVDADTGPALVVPCTVGVPGKQAVWLRLIAAAVGQGQLQNLRTRADVQVLLQRNQKKGKKTKNAASHPVERQKAERDKAEEERQTDREERLSYGLEEIMG